ncbi:hypothetical protein [Bosea sp. PAMC 26642]|nr:hypothetical protein [Bosea sp. PAMC 26642]
MIDYDVGTLVRSLDPLLLAELTRQQELRHRQAHGPEVRRAHA